MKLLFNSPMEIDLFNKEFTYNKTPLLFQWKVDLNNIKSNSDGGFPVGFNSMEVGRN